MPAPQSIVDLVDRFNLHKEAYKASNYNETQVRREFIDPFCKALGWDIDNEQGYAEAYKDVVHEDAIKVGGSTKAPDYAFRVGGTRKFFLEAKKPSVNIKSDIAPAFQLRRYAWSAKLPLSILTDFEEFAVYDCRVKPEKGDKASVARVSYFTCDSYVEKWDEIASVFSRQAILKGSFDKYADDNKRKRGTAQVDDAFLEEIEGWRSSLARNIALRNPSLSVHELNTAVQRTIDRIVFLRIAEDRGIETYGQLQGLGSGKVVYPALANLFRRADSRYNSGLFHFQAGEGSSDTLDEFTLGLIIDDKVLKPILSSLYYPDSPYEFSVLPADILGQVYERFLGKVIRLSGRSAIIEDKPEVKKAGGVYYTPAYISKYIVANVVGPLLRDRTPLQVSGLDKRRKDAQPLRIVDPACGSGSFLIEAYQYLMDWYLSQYVDEDPQNFAKGKEPRLYQVGNEWRLTISERRRILLTHIFGVDIDVQAVEVTKLSLLLKVLEGEKSDAIARQMSLFNMRALPDLGSNIRCGNSLIDSSFYRVYSLSLLSSDDRFRLNTFDWNDEFPFLKVFKGFDCVVGNPPYLYSAGGEYNDYFSSRFKFAHYQTDFYVYFIERGLSLLRGGGIIGYIIPDSWLNSDAFSKMRNALVNEWSVQQICTFKYQVFRSANIENTVVIVGHQTPAETITTYEFASPTERRPSNALSVADINRLGIIDPNYSSAGNGIITLLDRFDKMSSIVTLNRGIHAYRTDGYGQTAFGGTATQTKRDKDERSYHSATRKNKTWLPEIRGRDVFWARYIYSGDFIHYGPWLAEPRNPKFIQNPKVVFRKTLGNILSAALVKEPAAVDQSLYIAISHSNDLAVLKFVLGVTLSSLGAWFLRTKYSIYDRLHPWYTKKNLEDFPIPAFNQVIVDIVDQVLLSQENEAAAKTEVGRRQAAREILVYRKELDRAVFEAFGLSEQQKNVILAATDPEVDSEVVQTADSRSVGYQP